MFTGAVLLLRAIAHCVHDDAAANPVRESNHAETCSLTTSSFAIAVTPRPRSRCARLVYLDSR
ncbi:hypothetical protein CV102_02500 [Natronococcus pandeyae]|uniref:Uncharacterized protein n=1 Tax=Natronococcus pandeyae TaxID=2055836 RepID=A0A8J8TTZ9_9EURY|nr:hypothetical protein CV102_02500 [Natronococcus pandeyae]